MVPQKNNIWLHTCSNCINCSSDAGNAYISFPRKTNHRFHRLISLQQEMFHRFQQLQTIHLRFGSGQRHGSRRSRKSWFQTMGFPCNFSRMKYLKSKFRCYVWYFKISRMISLNIFMALCSCYFLDNISVIKPLGTGYPTQFAATVCFADKHPFKVLTWKGFENSTGHFGTSNQGFGDLVVGNPSKKWCFKQGSNKKSPQPITR